MGLLDKIMGRTQAQDIALAERIVAQPDVKGAPGTRIHHEYFVDPTPVNGRYVWLCRVYAADGTAHQMTGAGDSNAHAAQEAIRWAESTKTTLRGNA